jgi:hypothetical protein
MRRQELFVSLVFSGTIGSRFDEAMANEVGFLALGPNPGCLIQKEYDSKRVATKVASGLTAESSRIRCVAGGV